MKTHYGECCWGITSSDGPGPGTVVVDGIQRVFYGCQSAFNATFPVWPQPEHGWVSPYQSAPISGCLG